MSKTIIIPTTYGSPTATFWINKDKHVFPTGIEVTVPDEVAALVTAHANQLKKQAPVVSPNVVDVVFTFAGFRATEPFFGTSDKSFEDIVAAVGDEGVYHINLRIENTSGIISTPYRVETYSNKLIAYWIGNVERGDDKDEIHIYMATLSSTDGLNVTASPWANLWGKII